MFGTLELYGLAPNVYHTKLATTAAAGTDTLTLDQSVDWKVSCHRFTFGSEENEGATSVFKSGFKSWCPIKIFSGSDKKTK